MLERIKNLSTRTRVLITILALPLILGGGAFAYWTISPLFYDVVVSEDLPIHSESESQSTANQPETGNAAASEEAEMINAAAEESAQMGAQQTVSTSLLSTGTFVDADAVHKSSGTANAIEVSLDEIYVRFEEDFKTTNGPDLFVWLTKDGDVSNGYIDLGRLKGNIGSQNYLVPEGTDLSEYNHVLIWCKAFGVLFGTAVLN